MTRTLTLTLTLTVETESAHTDEAITAALASALDDRTWTKVPFCICEDDELFILGVDEIR